MIQMVGIDDKDKKKILKERKKKKIKKENEGILTRKKKKSCSNCKKKGHVHACLFLSRALSSQLARTRIFSISLLSFTIFSSKNPDLINDGDDDGGVGVVRRGNGDDLLAHVVKMSSQSKSRSRLDLRSGVRQLPLDALCRSIIRRHLLH